MKNAKMAASEQNGRLSVGRRTSVQRLFCASWSTLYAYQISFAYDKVSETAIFVALPWQRET